MIKKIFPFLLLLLFTSLESKSNNIKFRHLNIENGLTHTSVLDLYEDENGFIWIGTREGLNRYNGTKIDTFDLNQNDTYNLFSNNIKKITGNKRGKLFILCTDGLCEYDMNKEVFTPLWHDSDITNVFFADELYVSRGNTIFQYDENVKQFIAKYNFPTQISIKSLYLDLPTQTLYAGCSDGLYTYDLTKRLVNKLIDLNSDVSSIFKDSQNNFWVSTWNEGLIQLKDNKIVKQLTYSVNNPNSLSSNFVRSCNEDDMGNIWIGTFAGLNKYDPRTEKITHYTVSEDEGSLSHSSIWAVLKDQQGTIWLSTYFGGVNYFNPEYNIHKEYKYSKTEKKGLSSPIIGRMTEDNKGQLWICTEGAGVNILNRKTGEFQWLLPSSKSNSISHKNIKAIYFDEEQNTMWFGTHLGGLNKYNLETERFDYFIHQANDSTSIPSNIVRDIRPWKNYLLLATNNGVGFFDKNTGESQTLFIHTKYESRIKDVYAIHVDSLNNLWISVIGEGVYRYNLIDKTLEYFNFSPENAKSISSNNVNSIYEDRRGNIYFCTAGKGLDRYSPQTNTFKNYNKADGLISDYTYNVIETADKELLVITNLGFSRFNTASETFRNYSLFNGFPLPIINDNAIYVTKDKEVFLGGVNGLVSFHLKGLDLPTKEYDVFLDKLYINNERVKPNDHTSVLSTTLSATNNIKLKHQYNTLGFEVSTNNYIPYNKGQLVYKLEGFSDSWVPLNETDRIITYTNLSPGKYKLVVKSESEDKANLAQTFLNIEILPPWYKTPWAYLGYLLLFLLVAWYLIRTYIHRLELQTSLKYEQEHIKNVEKLNQSKLNFYTNLSHEFRTPLTVIIGQLSFLLNKESFTSTVYNKILSIYKNSLQLNDLITELLDFRKQEDGHMSIKASENDMVQLLNENYILFKEFADTKDITFTYSTDFDELNVWFSPTHIQKVINNLLSNAFKHTPAKGKVSISLGQRGQNCVIEVKDNGEGIDAENLKHIFERFYQVDDSNQLNAGSGIGLALSKGIIELHKGNIEATSTPNQETCFTITLPLGNKHFDKDQLATSQENNEDSHEAMLKEIKKFKLAQQSLPKTMEEQTEEDTKLLIVEDNPDLRATLVDIFSTYYTVISAEDGEEGLSKVQEENPDIIISDIVMPKMTGTELCKAVKNDINTCHIPFILLTAKTSLEHNLEGLKIGADDYIAKPFNIEILISRCNNLINSRRLLQEIFSKQPQMTVQKLATNPLDKKTLDMATEIIEKNMDNTQFNLNDFAQAMGMSRTNLFTKIKALTGQTPNNFISTMRLKKAAYLLRMNPELNISEIASMTGFSTSHYFSKCFKDAYEQTPSDYRKGDDLS